MKYFSLFLLVTLSLLGLGSGGADSFNLVNKKSQSLHYKCLGREFSGRIIDKQDDDLVVEIAATNCALHVNVVMACSNYFTSAREVASLKFGDNMQGLVKDLVKGATYHVNIPLDDIETIDLNEKNYECPTGGKKEGPVISFEEWVLPTIQMAGAGYSPATIAEEGDGLGIPVTALSKPISNTEGWSAAIQMYSAKPYVEDNDLVGTDPLIDSAIKIAPMNQAMRWATGIGDGWRAVEYAADPAFNWTTSSVAADSTISGLAEYKEFTKIDRLVKPIQAGAAQIDFLEIDHKTAKWADLLTGTMGSEIPVKFKNASVQGMTVADMNVFTKDMKLVLQRMSSPLTLDVFVVGAKLRSEWLNVPFETPIELDDESGKINFPVGPIQAYQLFLGAVDQKHQDIIEVLKENRSGTSGRSFMVESSDKRSYTVEFVEVELATDARIFKVVLDKNKHSIKQVKVGKDDTFIPTYIEAIE